MGAEQEIGSFDVARAAVRLALTESRDQEKDLKQHFTDRGIHCCAVDFGGDYATCATKIIERSVVAAKREGVITEQHKEVGAVAGAAHEALQQVSSKAFGFSIGGKIGIARYRDHLSVCVFFGVGLLHLNEVCIGLGHRAV